MKGKLLKGLFALLTFKELSNKHSVYVPLSLNATLPLNKPPFLVERTGTQHERANGMTEQCWGFKEIGSLSVQTASVVYGQ